ncbi:hypothetical protein [Ilumatobacter sp.]|uniref:hypothetical protein n=1 Tax=Ilumatobacter sp. TaxID=1967498 RepID=UPI003AF8DA08
MPGGAGAVVVDLLHTLVDPEPLRPSDFDAIAEQADVSVDPIDHLVLFVDVSR